MLPSSGGPETSGISCKDQAVVAGRQYNIICSAYDNYGNRHQDTSPGFILNSGVQYYESDTTCFSKEDNRKDAQSQSQKKFGKAKFKREKATVLHTPSLPGFAKSRQRIIRNDQITTKF
jgi:hypothetical protein